MKDINSVILLQSASRKLTELLEILDRIKDEDFQQTSVLVRNHPKHIKSIQDAISNGNIFMAGFFIKELIEIITHEDAK